jgi:hypothetical protein
MMNTTNTRRRAATKPIMQPAVRTTTRMATPNSTSKATELAELRKRIDRAEAKLEGLRSAQMARIPLDGHDYLTLRARHRNAILDAEAVYDFARAGQGRRALADVEREFARCTTLDLRPKPKPIVLLVDERFGDALLEYRGGRRHGERLWVRSDGQPLCAADIDQRQREWWSKQNAGVSAGVYPRFPSAY